ncbi:MAG TPA: SpoIID/LytB domain-containing protein [Candidatus Limnocylindrales bacterium]|jgi:hypothetical protein
MHRRLAVWMCALILAATAVALPSRTTPTVDAAAACTDWKSTYAAPTTIRVLRTSGPAAGTVQVVPFRAYVENVMAWEWPETYPLQALRAGAVAVKQFGWYYAIHWRGGKAAGGACYDVVDTATDQLYRPETRSAGPTQLKAVASTWSLTIRRKRNGRPGKFILTGYHPGSVATCGGEKNGFRLYQKGVKACANAGMSSEQIARVYYGGSLQLTDTGRHNTAGKLHGHGDIGAIVPNGDDVAVHVHQSSGSAFVPPTAPDIVAVDDDDTLSRISADVDGDGDEELVMLISDGDTAQHIEVRHPEGQGFGDADPGLTWDSATAGMTFESRRDGRPAVRLAAGDVDSDGDDDLLLVVTEADPTTGSVGVLESWKTSLQPLATAFAGAFDPGTSGLYAGDATGDGRADIIIETATATGLTYRVLATQATPASAAIAMSAPTTWYTGAGLTTAGTRTIVTDYDRDSRDDLMLAIGTVSGLTYRALHSTGKLFQGIDLYNSSIAVDRVKLISSDVNRDGRGDVVAYTRLSDGSFGTRLYVYKSVGDDLAKNELWDEDTTLDWETVEPY